MARRGYLPNEFCALLIAAILLSNAARLSFAAVPEKKSEPTKVAFLVGVSEYDKAGLRNLKYAESDVTDLAAELRKASFDVTVLTGSGKGDRRATHENLKTQLQTKFVEKIKSLKKSDIVLIGFSGHGLQMNVTKGDRIVEDAFYCPVDALKSDPATLLSISDLIDSVALNSGAENNLFVIDACRDNPAKGGKGIDGSRISLPGNMACLFGASSGTQSYESEKLKHGLLTHYLLEGLRGQAKDSDGEVNWDSLVGYTKKQVTLNARKWVEEDQTPNSISNIRGAPPILARITAAWIEKTTKIIDDPKKAKPVDEKPNYLPLDIGNEWVYKVKATKNGETRTAEMTNTIRKTVKIDGFDCAVLESVSGGKLYEVEYLANTATGLFRFKLTNTKFTPALCVIQYPFKLGVPWQQPIAVRDDTRNLNQVITFRGMVLSKEDVTIPSGAYKDCIVLEVSMPTDPTAPYSKFWYADKVGIVKQIVNAEGIYTESELASFKPAKKAAAVAP